MKNIIKKVTKGVIFAYVSTFILIGFFSALLTYTSLSESKMGLLVNIVTIVSLIIGGFYVGKNADTKGWLWGVIVGLLYISVLIIMGFILNKSMQINQAMTNLMLVAILGGLVGGIIGINAKNMVS